MQAMKAVINTGQTNESSIVSKKFKPSSNSTKTSKNDLQFAEIFGQLSLALLGTITDVKQTTDSQADTYDSLETAVKVAKSTDSTTEVALGVELLASQVKQLTPTINSEIAVGVTIQPDTNQLCSSNNQSNLTTSITGSKVSGVENSAITSTYEEMQGDATAASAAKADQSEIKAVVLMTGSSISKEEDSTSHPAKQDTTDSSIKPAANSSDISISNRGGNSENGELAQKARQNAGEKYAAAAKNEVADNAVVSDAGVKEIKNAEISGVNAEKTIMSKIETDFLVSKMVEHIKAAPSSLEVSLKPEYLGKIQILVQSTEGQISVNILAANGEALNLLNSNLQSIKDNLEQQGIKVQQMEVNLANQEKQDNQSGSRYRGESQLAPKFIESNFPTEYLNSADWERNTLLSYELNVLA